MHIYILVTLWSSSLGYIRIRDYL